MILVRNARPEDVPRIRELEELCTSEPWTAEQLAGEFSHPYARLFVAEEEGAILGYGHLHILCDDAHINEIGVHPDHRRRGAGALLMEEFFRVCKEENCAIISLEVRTGNAPAIALYEKYGFTVAGVRKRFYRLPAEDAYTMITKFEA